MCVFDVAPAENALSQEQISEAELQLAEGKSLELSE